MEEKNKLNIDDTLYETEVPDTFKSSWRSPDPRLIKAFIPGTVIEVKVRPGQKVEEDGLLLILDAMKMYNEITSPLSGTVAEVAVKAGERVEKDQLLIRLQ